MNSGVDCHFLLPEDLPDPGIKTVSPASPALAGGFFPTEAPGRPLWFLSIKEYDQVPLSER